MPRSRELTPFCRCYLSAITHKLARRIHTSLGSTPFRDSQEQARDIIEDEGEFILIHVKCSVEAAEERDPKGLYQKARAGKIEKFTGINHPFQEPLKSDIVVDTEEQSIEEGVEHVLSKLRDYGLMEERLDEEYDFPISRAEEEKITERLAELGYLNE